MLQFGRQPQTLDQYNAGAKNKIVEWEQELIQNKQKWDKTTQNKHRNKIAAQKSRVKEMKVQKGFQEQLDQTKQEMEFLAKVLSEEICSDVRNKVMARLVGKKRTRGGEEPQVTQEDFMRKLLEYVDMSPNKQLNQK